MDGDCETVKCRTLWKPGQTVKEAPEEIQPLVQMELDRKHRIIGLRRQRKRDEREKKFLGTMGDLFASTGF